MARLRFTTAAKDDLASISEYVAANSGSRTTAERFTGQLRQKCRELAAASIIMGRPRGELRVDLRSHPFGNYVIFFRYIGDVLEIVNVIEAHRDIEAFFADQDQG